MMATGDQLRWLRIAKKSHAKIMHSRILYAMQASAMQVIIRELAYAVNKLALKRMMNIILYILWVIKRCNVRQMATSYVID